MPISKWFSRCVLLRAAHVAAAAVVLSPIAAHGQVVRGVVVDDAAGRGLPGVVVVLLDSAGKRLAGVLADEEGRYAIRIAAPGRYSVRAERIGYRADQPTPVTLAVGQTVELRLATHPIPVVLSAVRVAERSPCVTGAADGREVSTVWEETRKALYVTDLTQEQELFSARISRYARTLDARTGRVTGYETTQSAAVTRNPFVSVPAAQLSANGYVRQGSTENTYFAPDAAVLLSDEFLRDHCFRLRQGEDRREGLIGLGFEPVRGRNKPDIAGTLWIDRTTAELRDLEYAYKQVPNLPSTVKSEDFGGRVEFHRLPSGAWIVERWVIRMPVLVDAGTFARRPANVVPGSPLEREEPLRLSAIHEEGGEVIETVARGVRRGFATEVASVRGSVFDSTRMLPLQDARVFLDGTQFSARSGVDGTFTIDQVPSGTYSVSVVHPRFDSLNVRAPSATLTLIANQASVAQLAGPSASTILAHDCKAEDRGPGYAALRGRVRDGFSAGPAIGALVTVTWNRLVTAATHPVPVVERRLETRTDSAGRYAFCGLPEGVKLTARAIADDRRSTPLELKLAEGEVSVVDIVVGIPAVVAAADPAKTAAAAASTRAPRNTPMQQFERRRRRGSGSFLTRAQIDRQHASRLTDLLRTMAGVTVEPDENGALVVLLRRSTMFSVDPRPAARSDSGSPQPQTAAGPQMSVKKCPAAFQLDGLPIDGGATADLDVKPEQVEAIEVYPGGQVPIELGARTSMCGVVFIWTRYYAERPETGPGA